VELLFDFRVLTGWSVILTSEPFNGESAETENLRRLLEGDAEEEA
jgi:hypothetical protein